MVEAKKEKKIPKMDLKEFNPDGYELVPFVQDRYKKLG